jgi:hypothetical protein
MGVPAVAAMRATTGELRSRALSWCRRDVPLAGAGVGVADTGSGTGTGTGTGSGAGAAAGAGSMIAPALLAVRVRTLLPAGDCAARRSGVLGPRARR